MQPRRSKPSRLAGPLAGLWRARRGGVAATAALTLPALMAVCALAVDLGFLYLASAHAGTAATYAADSGATRLPDTAAAEAVAGKVAAVFTEAAGYADETAVTAEASATGIEVTVRLEIDTVFAAFIGRESMRATRVAVREID